MERDFTAWVPPARTPAACFATGGLALVQKGRYCQIRLFGCSLYTDAESCETSAACTQGMVLRIWYPSPDSDPDCKRMLRTNLPYILPGACTSVGLSPPPVLCPYFETSEPKHSASSHCTGRLGKRCLRQMRFLESSCNIFNRINLLDCTSNTHAIATCPSQTEPAFHSLCLGEPQPGS